MLLYILYNLSELSTVIDEYNACLCAAILLILNHAFNDMVRLINFNLIDVVVSIKSHCLRIGKGGFSKLKYQVECVTFVKRNDLEIRVANELFRCKTISNE